MKSVRTQGLVVALACVFGAAPGLRAAAPPSRAGKWSAADRRRLQALESAQRQFSSTAQFAEALDSARQVLVLREKLQGRGHWQVADARRDVAHWQRLAAWPAAKRKKLAEGYRWAARGTALRDRHQYPAAVKAWSRALAIRREMLGEEHPHTAHWYNGLAACLKDQGKYAAAQTTDEKALAIQRKALGEEHPATALSYNNVASCLDYRGRHAAAQPLYEKALGIYRKVLGERDSWTALGYNNLAANLDNQGKYAEAQPLHEKALVIRRKVLGERHSSTAMSYNNLAANLDYQGKYPDAQLLYEKALAITRRVLGEVHPSTAISYLNLAANLNDQGKSRLALPLSEKALSINRMLLGDRHPRTGASYLRVGSNLTHQGRHAEAEPLLKKALAIFLETLGEDHPGSASACNALAYNLQEQDQYASAQPLFEKALAIRRRLLGEDHPDTAESYNNAAYNLTGQRKHAQARPLYEKALAIRRRLLGVKHPITAHCYQNAAYNLVAQGKFAEAQPWHEKALVIYSKTLGKQHPHTALCYTNLAFVLHAQGKYKEAVTHLHSALIGHDLGRLDSSTSGFHRAFFTAAQGSPRPRLAACLARLKRPLEAWQHAEADLARGLLDDLPDPSSRPDDSPRALLARVQRLNARLLSLLIASDLPADKRKLRDRLLALRRKLLAELSKHVARQSAQRVWSLKRIQKHIPADAALVLWIDASREHWGCVLRREGSPRWEKLVGSGKDKAWSKADDSLPARLYAALIDPSGDKERERARLTKALLTQRLAPLQPHLKKVGKLPAVRRLLVVPAGEMARVPLEALTDDYRISYVPSASVFASLAEKHRRLQGTSLLALGDPVFAPPARVLPKPPAHGVLLKLVVPGGNAARGGLQGGDVILRYGATPIKRVADLKPAAGGGLVKVLFWRQGKEAVTQLGPGRLGVAIDPRPAPVAVRAWREADRPVLRADKFEPLPGSRFEVESLARLLGKERTTMLLGSKASEQELDRLRQEKRLTGVRLLHFATHGAIQVKRPELSALILARDRLPDAVEQFSRGRKVYDGELRVATVLREWDLDADLVVLSACQTGLGKQAGGEGLLGFAQAFLQKGARSVVLSRWKVHDTATALLMERFYQNLLGKNEELKGTLGRAEALAEARNWLKKLSRAQVEKRAATLVSGEVRGREKRRRQVVKGIPAGDRPFAHPFYWAAFVLLGDPE